jgi:gluconokinase
MPQFPRSPFDLTGGLLYFGRMCDKIRLHAASELPPEYHDYLGKGFDGRLCGFLRIDYDQLKEKVLSGATDDEALAWSEQFFGPIGEMHRVAWNGFAGKRGWRDHDGGSESLARFKAAASLQDREDIATFFDFYEVDEGRKP